MNKITEPGPYIRCTARMVNAQGAPCDIQTRTMFGYIDREGVQQYLCEQHAYIKTMQDAKRDAARDQVGPRV